MKRLHPHWFGGVTFTVAMIALIALAIPDVVDFFFLIMIGVVIGGAAFFYIAFPGSRLFSIAFANFIAVYACIFVFFMQTNFQPVSPAIRPIGFLLPFAGFLFSAWLRRAEIRSIVTSERLQEERHFGNMMVWLVPVFGIGALTFFLPELDIGRRTYDVVFLAAMAAIGTIVGVVSRQVTIFLVDTGVLFEEFFHRMSGLMVPAFAFLTFYSLNIIIFASIYRILDKFSTAGHFRIGTQIQEMSFADALYFSVITLSTVGYGEMVPATNLAKVIVAVQIVVGVLLLLFGFSEIITYSREKRGSKKR